MIGTACRSRLIGLATQPVKKGERIAEYVNALGWPKEGPSPYYLAYFNCFNGQEYYEAHDVLEHLWLRGRDANSAFYQGLIQLAGAFVHLKKQWSRPEHPKDGRRMHPAVRLFRLAEENLSPYRPEHLGLNLEEVFTLIEKYRAGVVASDFSRNPWHPETAPELPFPAVRA